MFVAGLTSFQIQGRMRDNSARGYKNIAAIATGSIEQHGPLLPLNTDTVIAEASLAELDRREDERLFVYPSIQFTNADSGLAYVGTLSVGHDTFRRMLRETVQCVKQQRYDGLLFLDGHAINRPSLFEIAYEAVADSFRENRPFPVIILCVYQFYEFLAEKYDLNIGKHADWFEGLLFRASGGCMPSPQNSIVPRDASQICRAPAGVAGIPLDQRSDRGVIGAVHNEKETEMLRELIWKDYLDLLSETFRASVSDFFDQFCN